MIKHETATLIAPDGKKLFTQSWLPDSQPRATLIIQHGLGEHSGRYDHVARYFTDLGYAVYAMDFRGYGRSVDGDKGYFPRFDQLVEDLKQFADSIPKHGPLYLIGHSIGGLLAVHYTIRYGDTLKGLILSGAGLDAGGSVSPAAIQIAKLLGRVTPRLGLTPIDSTTISKDPAFVQKSNTDPLNFYGKVSARVASELLTSSAAAKANMGKIRLPVLILHGGADRLIDPSSSRFAYEHIGSADKTLKIYEGLYHEIFNEPERAIVLADVAAWLAQHS